MSRKKNRSGLGPPRINPTLSLDSGPTASHREKLGRGPLRGARRTTPRMQATLELTTGEDAGATFDIQTRDSADGGLAFMLKRPLDVGQAVRIINAVGDARDSDAEAYDARVVRSRPISNGRYEVAAQLAG